MSMQIQADNAAKQQDKPGIKANGNDAASLKNQFMKLMIAQIKNQDPTNPMDANKFISQLATFSQVESLEHMRKNQLTQMSMMQNTNMLESASLLGKQAMVPASQFNMDTNPVKGKVLLKHDVSALDIDVLDQYGNVATTMNLGSQASGDVPFSIDPKALGLPKGQYTLKITAKDGEQAITGESFLSAPINKIHFVSAKGTMMAELGHGLGAVSVLDISEVS
ncbi:basal-body rod modification protein FlgD [Shewanella sp. NFH-SH190041]|uniref:flagellar hook assembly protein FlgD n=1 Tax=Shewanella sp. NFH-SH190041 TaxID=2950245 RepID=UPI0021C39BC0|nr:flagellar hook capping FlgD N-terminal domain-containing protein [Shewanella sp. NFH-SH190041]BDM62721.1 basal-body rod modification protein FlgD [Shewanella sp. NFH-SH190041]